MSVIERLLRRDGDVAATTIGDLAIEPMRRRDLRGGVMAIESVSYPRPWSQSVFESEIAQMRSGTRRYLVARRQSAAAGRRGPVVGYAGLLVRSRRRPRHQRRGGARRTTSGRRHGAPARIGRRGDPARVHRLDARGARVEYRRPGAVPPVRIRARRRADPLLREHRGRDRHVVPRHPGSGLRRTASTRSAGRWPRDVGRRRPSTSPRWCSASRPAATRRPPRW